MRCRPAPAARAFSALPIFHSPFPIPHSRFFSSNHDRTLHRLRPKTFESRLYAQWESSGVFAPAGDGPAYTILLPPPNVTGTLHMRSAEHTSELQSLMRISSAVFCLKKKQYTHIESN